MADDLNRKLQAEIARLRNDVDRILRTNPIESTSVTSGRLRFIGGLLRVDTGGRVEIVGTLRVDGSSTINGASSINGPATVTGTFRVEGPWTLSGDGTITGDVVGTGTLTWNGPWNLNGAGKIAGNVDLTGNFDVKGTGRVKVGNMVIDPSDGGSVTFPGGAKLEADSSGGARLTQGINRVYVGAGLVSMQQGTGRAVMLSSSGITLDGVAKVSKASAPEGAFVGAVGINSSGQLYEVIA